MLLLSIGKPIEFINLTPTKSCRYEFAKRLMQLKLSCGQEALISQFPNIDQVNLRQVLESVKVSHPAIYQRWCSAEGQLRENLNIFINGDHIRYRNGLDTAVVEGDEIYIVPLITGG